MSSSSSDTSSSDSAVRLNKRKSEIKAIQERYESSDSDSCVQVGPVISLGKRVKMARESALVSIRNQIFQTVQNNIQNNRKAIVKILSKNLDETVSINTDIWEILVSLQEQYKDVITDLEDIFVSEVEEAFRVEDLSCEYKLVKNDDGTYTDEVEFDF